MRCFPSTRAARLSTGWNATRWRLRRASWSARLAIAWFFFFGLPQIAESIAREIPPAAETLIGEQTMEILDRTTLQPTTLSTEQQQDLTDALRRFVADMPYGDKYRLEFRKLPGDLPNAFAIPGGAIVVSDGLVAALQDEDAFLAVVAHEIGHQVHRHVLRQVLQGSAVIVAATMLTGDVSSATGVVLAVPTFLLSSRYSRDFEREADEFAFATLRDRGITSGMVRATRCARLEAHVVRSRRRRRTAHPTTSPRTPRLRTASMRRSNSRARIRTARSDRREADGGERRRGRDVRRRAHRRLLDRHATDRGEPLLAVGSVVRCRR